ncbi:MAG: sulfotransferase [Pseudomonadota bacterium]
MKHLLIIGAMKCGTTTLFNLLRQHPAIAPSDPKEPGFFAFDDAYAKGMDWYRGLFDADAERTAYLLDGSTDYSKSPHFSAAPDRIRVAGEARLIYLMRHPLKRIESHAQHVAIAQMELERIPMSPPYRGLDDGLTPAALDITRYAYQLDQFKDYFDAGRLFLSTLEELSADPQGVSRRVFEFLELDPINVEFSTDMSNRRKGARRTKDTHPVWAALSAVGPLKSAAKGLVPAAARRRLQRATAPKEKLTGRFDLTEEERADIMRALNDDLDRLKSVYGFDPGAAWDLSAYRPS